MRRAYLVAIAGAIAVFLVPAAALAAPPAAPPMLTGEQFVATFPPAPAAVQATCDPSGTSTLTLVTGGIATGPYPGTWTGTILVSIGPQTGPPGALGLATGQLARFDEIFRIDSPAGVVSGRKTLVVDVGNAGQCREFHGQQPPEIGLNVNGYLYAASAQTLVYEATIAPPGGHKYRDEGTSRATLTDSYVTCCPNEADHDLITLSSTGRFEEQFTSVQQLTPGRGCGDDNHVHERQDECK